MKNKIIEQLKKDVFIIQYNDFDDLVKKTYGHKFSFLDVRTANNDSVYLFRNVHEKIEDEDDQEELDNFIESGETDYCIVDFILQDLVKRNKLKKGHYLIEVCW